MIAKYTGGKLYTIDGELTDIHASLGYVKIAEDGIDVDSNGKRFSKYMLNDAGRYVKDVAQIVADEALVAYNEAKVVAKEAIDRIKVTVTSGMEFYADPESRTDLSDAISIMREQGLTEYQWKTTTGVQLVTLVDMIEARTLGLVAKGNLVGVSDG